MIRSLLTVVALASLCGCGQTSAPEDTGVCWRADEDATGASHFTPLARGIGSLEDCAVLLEAVRLQGAPAADGAYQGYFIFVDADRMTSSVHARGFRYPILQPPQRAEIDRDLRRLLKERGGRLPDATDLTIEHH